MMLSPATCLVVAGLAPVFALAAPPLDSVSVQVQPRQMVNGVVEYTTQCKTCPYNLCTNVNVPWGGENVTLTCWARWAAAAAAAAAVGVGLGNVPGS